MIIPIRCFTCGKVLADKYDYYLQQVQDMEHANKQSHLSAASTSAAATAGKKAKELLAKGVAKAATDAKNKQDKQDKQDKEDRDLAVKQEAHDTRHFDTIRTGPILDSMGLTRYCCRRHMLSTVDMMEVI